jgi:hypothetical protein
VGLDAGAYILLGTLAVALISAIASIRSCQISNSSNKKDTVLQKQSQVLEGLRTKIKESESVLSSQQTTIDSLKWILSGSKVDTPKTPTKPNE